MQHLHLLPALLALAAVPSVSVAQGKAFRLETPWSKKVSRTRPHPEYPRPLLVRKNWVNLNGVWDLAIAPEGTRPAAYGEKILVPFPVESELSGVGRMVPEGHTVWYRRTFSRPSGERMMLHFQAVDWHTRVWVNGQEVGEHRGGFDPFSFDITAALKATGKQEIVVAVVDPTDAGPQPHGKQVRKPGGIMYTPSTGIWQTVWLEAVPATSIERLDVAAKNDGTVRVLPTLRGGSASAWVEVLKNGQVLARKEGSGELMFHVEQPQLWSPQSPTLYQLRAGVGSDIVESYFAFREVGLGKDAKGRTTMTLNGEPIFMMGTLDQGFWPDGLFTPPTDAAMKYDVDITKKLGFNTIRKHVKVEPATWYAYCDRKGILVWQDMPSGDTAIPPDGVDIERTPESKAIFEQELKAMVDHLRNHPSIVSWVLFNEGWGQFETARMSKWLKDYDSSRILNAVTGWVDRGTGDLIDWHVYPGPASPDPEPHRAASLGEFGGLGLRTAGHMWQDENWGYQSFTTEEALTQEFERIFLDLNLLRDTKGLSAAIYTQTTDVETEANGLLTYDRKVMKMDPKRVYRAVTSLYGKPITMESVLATADVAPSEWRYTESEPATGWTTPDFDDSAWRTGTGGFGTAETPNTTVRTEWKSDDIWVRKAFDLPKGTTGDLYLRVFHDEDAEIFLDGQPMQKMAGYMTSYRLVALPKGFKLGKGRHTLAVHCHQTTGGQYIDVGLVRVKLAR